MGRVNHRDSGSWRFRVALAAAAAYVLSMMYVSVTNGSFDISPGEVLQTLLRLNAENDHVLVVFDFRLPRIVIGVLVGFGLGITGGVLQGITRNPLADPGILGIQAAAGTFVVLYIFLYQGAVSGSGWFTVMTMPMLGMLGGLAAVVLLYLFARNEGGFEPQRLILVGIALSSGFGAVTLFISLKMNPQDFEQAVVWLAGSIYSANWRHAATLLPWLIVLVPVMYFKSRVLDTLQLHEGSAAGLGVRIPRERAMLLLCCVGVISACVAVSGSIGFVGLLAPHIARRLSGISYRRVLPLCGLIGSALVVTGDFAGRVLFAPSQLPAGIVISIFGVPYFLLLLLRLRRGSS